jgi:hypothetical protein
MNTDKGKNCHLLQQKVMTATGGTGRRVQNGHLKVTTKGFSLTLEKLTASTLSSLSSL